MNQNIISEIDKMLSPLINRKNIALYYRWKQEYKDRVLDIYRSRRVPNLPPPNSGDPGFEINLIHVLCKALKKYDPHCEWPYASYVYDNDYLRKKCDIYIVRKFKSISFTEVWFEIGMYSSGEYKKYSEDFEKLSTLLKKSSNSIGVLVHIEIFPCEKVLPLFRLFEHEYSNSFNININTLGDTRGIYLSRLIMQNKNAEQNEPDPVYTAGKTKGYFFKWVMWPFSFFFRLIKNIVCQRYQIK